MKTRVTLIVNLFLLCTILAAQEPQSGTLNAPFAGATISDFKGKVSIELPSHALASPSRGLVLPAETLISTVGGGRMLLRLSDGSDLLVKPETRLLIKQPEAGAWRYVQMLVGRVRAEIQKRLSGASGFQMGTPSAVISVRGTKFEVEVNRSGITEVDVNEGVVELDSSRGMGESVLIREGFSSRVGFESGPESPRPTREMRPEVDRPGHIDDKHHGRDDDDDPVRRLRASAGSDHRDSGPDSHDSNSGSGSSGSAGSGSSGGSGSSDSSGGQDTHDSDTRDSGDRSGGGHHPPEL